VLLVAGGIWYFLKNREAERTTALAEAIEVSTHPPSQADDAFAAQRKKNVEVLKAFQSVIDRYPGTNQAGVAYQYIGSLRASENSFPEAEAALKNAIQHGNPDTASQAKYTLAQVYAAQGKEADAQKIYRELMNSPSLYVSKEQATIALAQSLVRTNPEEARKVIEPLKSMKSPAITEAVINITAELK
jgi:TolA-binding protein